jgi:hypothetical protein
VIFDGETGLADLSVTVPVPDITFLGQLSQPYTAALPKEEVERNRCSPVKVAFYDAGSTTSTRSPLPSRKRDVCARRYRDFAVRALRTTDTDRLGES